ncbi:MULTISPECIES: substrate-binding periplasmic protein [unclassified Undibacterium]|uniref:substrate-binding periplasmic protein n=2 Tax=Undibacterium TaxID=401469 RepID=UPI002AC9D926|nr:MULTISPECIES: transporter substrate-binding domain-containing protein [unclassified Undibacterium]MEB0217251.1 transporter substrate-binding domain-containing protein [Undibacterium sp. 5I2]WPX44301.1 transporter substrate-binding domain-containing protein [Undibacterium sp. CCC3.4]
MPMPTTYRLVCQFALCCAGLLLACSLAAAQNLQILTEDWPPISFGNDQQVDGMAVEVVRALQKRISKAAGADAIIQVVPWARGYKTLLEEPNTLLFTVGRSDEREKLMTLLGPIAVSSTALWTRKGHAARLRALGAGMQKLKVGAYRASIFADTARRHGFSDIEQAPTPQIVANMLFAKRFDLWVEGSFVVPSVLNDIGRQRDEVEKVSTLESLELFLAFSQQTSAATIKAWEEALRSLKKDGSFAKIYQKWLPNESVPMALLRIDAP